MTENHEMQKTPSMSAPSTEPSKVESQGDTRMSRRKALLGALFAGAAMTIKTAEASDANCSCLPAPDCNAVCPNGGSPRGDGTQACDCFENPPPPTLHPVAYSGDYNVLANRPNRAGSDTDGGDARNSIRWNGHELRKQHNPNASQIPVFSGGYVDFINKNELAGMPVIGARVIYGEGVLETIGSRPGRKWYTKNVPAVKRDQYGRVEAVGYAAIWTQCNCNCSSNCCNCGDDSRCFIKATLKTATGVKDVSEVAVGDRLVGLDGLHTVVAIVHGQLGKRKAVCPKGSKDVVLTEDHVVLQDGQPVVYSEVGKRMCHDILTAKSGIKGLYIQPWMDKMISVDPEAFECIEMPEDTPTYTLIVAEGNWGMTEDGTSVLLCQML